MRSHPCVEYTCGKGRLAKARATDNPYASGVHLWNNLLYRVQDSVVSPRPCRQSACVHTLCHYAKPNILIEKTYRYPGHRIASRTPPCELSSQLRRC